MVTKKFTKVDISANSSDTLMERQYYILDNGSAGSEAVLLNNNLYGFS